MKYKHRLTGEILTFVKSNGSVYVMRGKKYKILGTWKTSDIYICSKDNLMPLKDYKQGKLF